MSVNKGKSCEGTTSRQDIIEAEQDSNRSRTNIFAEMIAARSKAQMARCEDLMSRLRTIELAQVQDHVTKQLKHIDDWIDLNSGVPSTDENTPISIYRTLCPTDYDNSIIDCIEQEISENANGEYQNSRLKNPGAMGRVRFLYHKSQRKAVKANAHVLSEIIGNTLLDSAETESESEDETGEEKIYYKPVEKDKVRKYRPIDTTPLAKWAKYRSHFISSWAWLDQSITQTEFRIKKSEALYTQLKRAKPLFKLGNPPPPSMPSPRNDVKGATFQSRRGSTEAPVDKTEEQTKQKEDGLNDLGVSNALYEGAHSSSLNLLADVSELSESLKRGNIERVMNTIQNNRSANQSCQGVQKVIQSPPVVSPIKDTEGNDGIQVASRCRPLLPCKPRKVYKMHGIYHYLKDGLDMFRPGECQCKPSEACIGCLGNKYKWKPEIQNLSFKEKLEALDPCFHKSLSGPEDIPLSIILSATLDKMPREGIVERKEILKTFTSVGPEDLEPLPIRVQRGTVSNEEEVKKRSRGRLPTDYDNDVANKRKQIAERRKELRKSGRTGRLHRRRKDNSDDSNCDDDFGEVAQPSSSTLAAFRRLRRMRAGRNRMDFDITNIVIPAHYSSNTRVEKLTYKEIIIPRYRVVEFQSITDDETEERPKKTGIKREKRFKPKSRDYDDQFEDLDDDTIKARHGRCLEEEKRKFNSCLRKQGTSRRRGMLNNDGAETGNPRERISESTDGNEGTRPTTPTPSTSHSVVNDEKQVQVISSEDASAAASALKVGSNRRRKVSASVLDEEDDEEFTVAPFPRRQFPIPSDEFEKMEKEMPTESDCDE